VWSGVVVNVLFVLFKVLFGGVVDMYVYFGMCGGKNVYMGIINNLM